MTIFSDCEGVLLVGFLLHGTTINGTYYASLFHRLNSSIQKKLTRGVLLLHDNAPVHKSNITQAAIQYTDLTEWNHAAHSPEIVARDYHLFFDVKNFLRSRNFESDDGAIMTVNDYLESLDFLEA